MSLLQFVVTGKQFQLINRDELKAKLADLLKGYPDLLQALETFTKDNDPTLGLDGFIAGYEKKLRGIIPDKYLFLLDTLDHFQNKKVSLVDLQKSVGAAASPASLSIKVDSELTCDLITTDQLKDISKLVLAKEDALVKLGLAGDIAANLNADTDVGLLKYAVAFGASANQNLGYYLKFKQTDRAIALFSNLQDDIAAPADLAGLCGAMAKNRLVRFERHGGSATTLAVNIGVTEDLAGLFGFVPTTGTAKLDLKVEYKDNADQILYLEKIAGNKFSLGLEKTRYLQQSSSLAFGIDIKIIGLKDSVTNLINRLLPGNVGTGLTNAINRLDTITKDLEPTALADKLKEQLESRWVAQGKPALAALLSETDLQNPADNILKEIQHRLLTLVDERINKWNDDANTAAASVATRFVGELGLAGSLGSQLHDYLTSSLADPLKELKSKIDTAITNDLTNLTNEAVNALLVPWRFLDKELNGLVAKVTSSPVKLVDEAKQLLQKIYDRYSKFRQSLLDTVNNDLQENCTLSILSQKSRTANTAISLRAEFDQGNIETLQKLYEAMWHGDLTSLSSIANDLNASGIKLEGEYADTIKEENRTQFSLDLFGLQFTQETIFSSTVETRISPTGKLLVGTSEADFTTSRSKSGETLTIEADLRLNYLAASVYPPLTLKMRLNDNEFKPGEIADYFSPLESNQLVRTGLTAIIKEQLFPKTTITSIAKAVFSVNTILKWDDWQKLVANPAVFTPGSVCERYLLIYQKIAPSAWKWISDFLKNSNRAQKDVIATLSGLGAMQRDSAFEELYPGVDFHRRFEVDTSSTWHELACALHALDQGIGSIQSNWSSINPLLAKTPLNDDDRKALETYMQNINHSFQMIFDGVTDTGLIGDDAGKTRYNYITMTTLRLFQDFSNLPNKYLSCTFESDSTPTLNFS